MSGLNISTDVRDHCQHSALLLCVNVALKEFIIRFNLSFHIANNRDETAVPPQRFPLSQLDFYYSENRIGKCTRF